MTMFSRSACAALLFTVAAGSVSFAQSPIGVARPASQPKSSLALTAADVEQALEFGTTGQPAPYQLHHRVGSSGVSSVTVALVYTPFIRVALAARAAAEIGHELTANEVPADLVEPLIYVAFRWYTKVNVQLLPEMAAAAAAADLRVATVADRIVGNARERSLPPPPVWISRGVSALRSFAGKLPYDDVVLVAAYPANVLQVNRSFIIFKQWPSSIVADGMDSMVEEGLVTAADLARWR